MYDPPGHEDPADVTNPANYRLVAPGENGGYDTLSCAGGTGDDLVVPVTEVAWDGPSRTATLSFAGALPSAPYQLLVCATLTDLQGLPLDGDGDGVGGDDYLQRFRIDTGNALGNGHFDCDVSGWSFGAGSFLHGSDDEGGLADSGSALAGEAMVFDGLQLYELYRCGGVTPGRAYEADLRVRVEALGSPVAVTVGRLCNFFVSCGGAGVGDSIPRQTMTIDDTAGGWLSMPGAFLAPAGAGAVACSFSLEAPETQAFDAWFDSLVFRYSSHVFTDGFEEGDLSGWSSATP
jgi:hypothetical protein